MEIEETKERIALVLKKVRPHERGTATGQNFVKIGGLGDSRLREHFPLPELVLAISRILGFPSYGPEEKMRWGFMFDYEGAPYAFELHKFGLWLLAPERHPFESALTREVISRMKKAIAVLEELLEDVAEHQAAEGNVTIANMYPSLDRRYRFFRELAKEAYASPVPAPVVVEESPDGSMRHLRHDFMKPEREGFHFTGAMIDAYFSRLEHLLILVLPFIGFDPTQKRLLAFLDAPLSEKLKRVLDLADPPTKNTYDEFLRLRDLVRNPLAHGGIERGGRSVFFHVPMIGALPARMTAARDAVHHFRFTPLPEARYAECCKLFDALDAILEKPPTSSGVTWAGSGFDVAFDEESRAEFAAAMRSEGGLAKMIEDVSEEIAYHINMDY